MIPVPEGVLVAVTLLQEPEERGEFRVRVKAPTWRWETIPLRRGDTVVMSGGSRMR